MAYVYKHIRKDTNEVFYIGIGSGNTFKRAYKKSGRNKFWYNITRKTDYEVDILDNNISWEQACIKEKEYILLYGRRQLNKGSLVNLTDGGEGTVGKIMSEELKKFHRGTLNSNRAKTNEINRQLKLGKKLSKQTMAKLQGRKLSQESKNKISKTHAIPIQLFTKDNIFIKEFKSMVSAASFYNIAVSTIHNNIKGLSKYTKQGKWKKK